MTIHVPKFGSRVEHAIVRRLIAELAIDEWIVDGVDDGGDKPVLIDAASDIETQALEAVFAVADSRLYFKKGQFTHWVRLIVGNGEDIISDWSFSSRDGFGQCMDDACQAIEAGALVVIDVNPRIEIFSIFGMIEQVAAEHFIEAGNARRIPKEEIPEGLEVNENGDKAPFAIYIDRAQVMAFNEMLKDLRS